MDGITLGEIFLTLAKIAGVIGSLGIIAGVFIKFFNWINKTHKNKEINPIIEEMTKMEERLIKKSDEQDKMLNEKIDELKKEVQEMGISQCKDYLVRYMALVENGSYIDPVEEERAYEVKDKYTNVYHLNSYIHKRWEETVETRNNSKKEKNI